MTVQWNRVFNNSAVGPDEYLLFRQMKIQRSWIICPDIIQTTTIEVQPYELGNIIYSNDLTTGDDFGYSVKINDWNEAIVGAQEANPSYAYIY